MLLVRNLGRPAAAAANDDDDDDAVMAMVDAESIEEAAAAFSGVDGLNADDDETEVEVEVEVEEDESTPVAVTTAPNAVPASDGGGNDTVADEDEEEDEDDDEEERDSDAGAPACALLPPDTSAPTGNSAAESARPAGHMRRRENQTFLRPRANTAKWILFFRSKCKTIPTHIRDLTHLPPPRKH